MPMFVLLLAVKVSCLGASAFTMGNVRMQLKTTHFCNLDLIDEKGKPVPCHISKAVETEGLVLPGMDDGESITVHQDVFVAKDGQAVVQASPSHPYQYLVMSQNETHSETRQLYNKSAFLIEHRAVRDGDAPSVRRLGINQTLREDGWVYHGLVEQDGQKLNKWVRRGVEGIDPKSGFNFTAFAQTGLISNSWTVYLDEAETKIVKLLGTNTFENDKVYLETVVTHWEELDGKVDLNDAMQQIYSAYDIVSHSPKPPSENQAPQLDDRLIRTRLVGEEARLFFNRGEDLEWRPRTSLIRGRNSLAPIDFFRIANGTAAHKYFLAKPHNDTLRTAIKFELPPTCKDGALSVIPYCLYVDFVSNATLLGIDFYMAFADTEQILNRAHLNITVHLKQPESTVMAFAFEAGGCAVVWKRGIGFAMLLIQVCLTGADSGDHLIQPDKVTRAGKIAMSVSLVIEVSIFPVLKVGLHGEVDVSATVNNDIKAHGELGIDVSALVVGAGVSVDIFGNTVNHKSNIWKFQSHVNLNVWVNVLVYSHNWPWSWTIWEAGPVTLR
ncbi:hypothetical protein FOZ60_014112 [Perkinsus olseni]|uniref:Uncharacterized protein n=1 Tax=Perkinsus olseni TaxID=32597 RepID=A0A7J6N8F3_PEROL|nr:hypothetical protein FOZ60_014112 [Perkinsus olseni]